MNRIFLTIFMTICLLSTAFLIGPKISVRASPELKVHNVDTGLNYSTIQEAIDANETLGGHTIFVDAGTYYESVVVNKSVSLIGEMADGTTIDANGLKLGINVTSNNVSISNLTLTNSSETAIKVSPNISNTTIQSSRIISNKGFGIYLDHGSSFNMIRDNNITNSSSVGLYLFSAFGNVLNANVITSNWGGLSLVNSSSNVLRNNSIADSIVYNFAVLRVQEMPLLHVYLYHALNDVDPSNTVDGRPIYYFVSQRNMTIPTDAGCVILVNCTGIKVQGLTLEKNSNGIRMVSTNDSIISQNTIIGNSVGIRMLRSTNNTFDKNNISNNGDGFVLEDVSFDNRVCENNMTNNYVSISLQDSSHNRIYHNDFTDSTKPAASINSNNSWDDGYPSGGNYWSDYAGEDLHNGVYQNQSGFDWIGDSPYVIDENNTDRYPLMHQFSSETGETEVAYRSLLIRFNQMQTNLDSLNSSLNANINNLQGQVNILDLTVNDLKAKVDNLTLTLNQTSSNLQSQISSLSNAVAGLQVQFDTQNSTLQTSMDEQQQQYNSLSNQLNNVQSILYALIILTAVLVATTVYLAVRKPRTKPETW